MSRGGSHRVPELRAAREPELPPGIVGVVSGELARFTDFSIALTHVWKPPRTTIVWAQGNDITGNMNGLVNAVDNTGADWLWIMGDDHVFAPDLLGRLLSTMLSLDLDVVVPLCLKRAAPFDPVVYESDFVHEGVTHFRMAELPEDGVHEVHAAGSAGMLVRRRVLEAIPRPIFENRNGQNEDLVFCEKVRAAGHRIHCDPSCELGHIGLMQIWPWWDEGAASWGAMVDLGNGVSLPLRRRSVEAPIGEPLAEDQSR